MAERAQKLFAGTRIRRLRRELNITQLQMAGDLGISPSYLNLIERNQRPLSAQILLRLADTFDIIQGRVDHGFTPPISLKGNGKAMDFISDST